MAIAKEAQIDEVRDLVTKGKERGFLTNEEVIEALAPVDVSAEQMDNILQHLQDENIEVVEMVDELDAEEFAREARSARDEELALKAPTNDPVRMYLKEIGKVPLLTAEQEVILAKAIDEGEAATAEIDKATDNGRKLTPTRLRELQRTERHGQLAKKKLIEANLRLVVSIAKRYVGRGHAVPRPDPGGQPRPHPGRREVRLQQGLQVLHLRHLVDPPGHHPGHRRPGPHHPHPGAHGRDDQQADPHPAPAPPGPGPRAHPRGDRPRDGVLAREGPRDPARCPRSRCRWRPRSARRRTPTSATSSRTPTPSSPSTRPASSCSRSSSTRSSHTLSEREKKVIQLRFGLTDGHPRTLEEVGREFGVTRERIRQIESKTLSKLRHPSRSQKLRDYLE